MSKLSKDSDKLACLSDHGRKWLEVALDPYHDTTLELMGYPDVNGSPSFVLVVKNTSVITAPGGSVPWAAHFVIMPLNAVDVFGQWSPVSLTSIASGVSVPNFNYTGFSAQLGPVTVTTTTSESANYENWFDNSGEPTSTLAYGGGGLTNARVIASAFEVTDVTAKLYQQGSVTVYTAPSAQSEDMVMNFAGVSENFETCVKVESGPPNSLAIAQLMPNTRTWDASQGAYVVGRLTEVDNPPSPLFASMACIQDNSSVAGPAMPYPNYVFACSNAGGTSTMACSGAIFSGLNPTQGSLRLTTRVVYEVFPRASNNPQDPYLPLTSPSAPFDACAFQMYAEAVQSLPPGVPVRMNAAGDWFRMVMRTLADSNVLSAIHPGLGIGAKMVNSFVNPSTNVKSMLLPPKRNPTRNRRKVKKVKRRVRSAPR